MLFRSAFFLALALLLSFTAVERNAAAHGKNHNPVRYEFVMKNGIPAIYRGLTNSLAPNPEDLAAGVILYGENCASCHGAAGNGDGPDGKDLEPRPPALRGMMTMIARMKHGPGMMMQGSGMMNHGSMKEGADRQMAMMTEGYLYWTISEGGEALGTAMPAFKDVLSEKERWQLILFMSNGFKAN